MARAARRTSVNPSLADETYLRRYCSPYIDKPVQRQARRRNETMVRLDTQSRKSGAPAIGGVLGFLPPLRCAPRAARFARRLAAPPITLF